MSDADGTSRTDDFDPHCDPARLAHLGLMVRARLMGMPRVERVDVADADLFVVPQ